MCEKLPHDIQRGFLSFDDPHHHGAPEHKASRNYLQGPFHVHSIHSAEFVSETIITTGLSGPFGVLSRRRIIIGQQTDQEGCIYKSASSISNAIRERGRPSLLTPVPSPLACSSFTRR
jgi:hypothetical protein